MLLETCSFFRTFANVLIVTVMIGVGVTLAQEPEPEPEPAKETKYQYWTTSWSFNNIDLQLLSKRLKLIGFDAPVNVRGTATVAFEVGVPINAVTDTRAYRFYGLLTARDVQLDDATFPQLSATVAYEDGTLKLTNFRGTTKSGTFQGTAEMQINPQGRFEAKLDVRQLKLKPLIALFGKLSGQADLRTMTGVLDGTVDVSGNANQLNEFSTWDAKGNLSIKDFSVGESANYTIRMDPFSLQDQRVEIPNLYVTSPDHPSFFLRGHGDIRLDAAQAFTIAIEANDMPTADVLGLYSAATAGMAEGKLDLKGTARGELVSADSGGPNIDADLLIGSPDFRLFGVKLGLLEHRLQLAADRFDLTPLFEKEEGVVREIDSIQAKYAISEQAIEIKELAANVFGGEMAGSVWFDRTNLGTHKIDANWKDVTPSANLPLPWLTDPVAIRATTSGTIRWSASAERVDFPAFHQGQAEINLSPLTLDGEDLGSLTAQLKIEDKRFQVQASGGLLGGNIKLTSEAMLDPDLQWSDVPQMMIGGKLIIEQWSLGDTVRLMSGNGNRRFAGRVDGVVDFQRTAGGSLTWQSDLAVRDMTVDRRSLAQQLNARISQSDGIIDVESVRGTLAGGSVHASGQWALGEGPRLINVRLSRADAHSLMLPLAESVGSEFAGIVSGRGTISGIGNGPVDAFRVVGAARLQNGMMFGAPIGDAHSPFRVSARMNSGGSSSVQWSADFPTVSASLARGSVKGELKLSSSAGGSGVDLDSQWRMTHIEFEDLLKNTLGTDTIGRGDLTGNLVLSGRRIRSLNDFRGRFQFTLAGTDATAVPGLPEAGAALGVLSLSGARFTSGRAKGQISHGAINFEQLAMVSDQLKVEADGRVFLSGPRMDLRAVIATGNFQGQEVLSQQLSSLALRPIPGLTTLNQLVSDRTFVIDLFGTVRDPQVRLRSAETIQINLRRTLVREATRAILADALLIGE